MCFRDPLNPSGELSPTATHGRLCHTGPLKMFVFVTESKYNPHPAHASAVRMLCAVRACGLCFIKGTMSRDFRLMVFFHESVSPKPLSIPLGPFRIFSKIRRDIRS